MSFGIVQDHRGTIRIESELGHGATFVIELPSMQEIQPVSGDREQEPKHDEAVLVGAE